MAKNFKVETDLSWLTINEARELDDPRPGDLNEFVQEEGEEPTVVKSWEFQFPSWSQMDGVTVEVLRLKNGDVITTCCSRGEFQNSDILFVPGEYHPQRMAEDWLRSLAEDADEDEDDWEEW